MRVIARALAWLVVFAFALLVMLVGYVHGGGTSLTEFAGIAAFVLLFGCAVGWLVVSDPQD